MKMLVRSLVVTGLFLGCAQALSAQTANEIVEKHLAALGGRAALGKVTSRSMTGTIVLSTPGGEISGPFEVLNQAPNKARTFITLDLTALGAGKIVYDERFDGTSGYVIDSMQGNRDLTGDQLANLQNETFPTPFLGYKERGATVELAGKEKVGDREAYHLILRPKSGPAMHRYLDAESYLEVRITMTMSAPQVGEFEQALDFHDYRSVDGVQVPFKVTGTSSFQTFTVSIAKVEHNHTIDPALFAKPAN
jgi:outer membrane lipoprotein-sorting protein